MKARRERRSNLIATISGGNDGEVPPVPIPNTAVKLSRVESTGLEAAWEDRLLPVSDEAPVLYVRGLLLWGNLLKIAFIYSTLVV